MLQSDFCLLAYRPDVIGPMEHGKLAISQAFDSCSSPLRHKQGKLSEKVTRFQCLDRLVLLKSHYLMLLWVDFLREDLMHICSFQLNGIVQELETVLFIKVGLAFKSDSHLADLFIEFLPEKLSFGKLVPHDILVEVDEKTGKTCRSGFITNEFDRARCQYINLTMQNDVKGISSVSIIK